MEIKISNLMDYLQDDTVIFEVKDIASADKIKEATMNKLHANGNMTKKVRKRALLTIAAAVCFIVALSTVALATNLFGLFGLKNLIIPSETSYIDEENKQNIISLQGYANSPEYKGFAEWYEYDNSRVYDPDGTILNAIGNRDTGLDRDYLYYGCYTQEMADKLDEIAGKYGLTIHGKRTVFDTVEEFMDNVANGDFISKVKIESLRHMYEDGSFRFDGSMGEYEPEVEEYPDLLIVEYDPASTSPEEIFAPSDYFDGDKVAFMPIGGTNEDVIITYKSSGEFVVKPNDGEYDIVSLIKHRSKEPSTGFQFTYNKKGTLDYVGLSIGNYDDWEEWAYETSCGVVVNLAQGTYNSLLIVETESAFVTVNILAGRNSDSFTATEFEAFADTIDFTLLK